ncbi:MAG TPA: GNAT family N-acetyltransferase [Gaiellaceae bacterium]
MKTPRFVVVGGADGVWASVQGIRLRDGEAPEAVAHVRELLATPTRVVSWWLSERATPETVEEQLLDAGLQLLAHDYLLDGLLATTPPPEGPADVEVRMATSPEQWAEIRELMDGVFDNPPERRPTREQMLAEFAKTSAVLFGAWLDGELVGAAGATPSSRGMLLWGGSVRDDARGRGCYRALVSARWDEAVRRGTPALTVSANDKSGPVLRKLGFENVLELRRLEDVISLP